MNSEGIPIRTTLSQGTTAHYVSLMHGLLNKTKAAVKEMDHLNELTFLRLRSYQNEILIAPDKEFSMVIIQKPIITWGLLTILLFSY